MENTDYAKMAAFVQDMSKKDMTFRKKIERAYNMKAEEIGKDRLNQNLKDFGINLFLFLTFSALVEPAAKLIESFK